MSIYNIISAQAQILIGIDISLHDIAQTVSVILRFLREVEAHDFYSLLTRISQDQGVHGGRQNSAAKPCSLRLSVRDAGAEARHASHHISFACGFAAMWKIPVRHSQRTWRAQLAVALVCRTSLRNSSRKRSCSLSIR